MRFLRKKWGVERQFLVLRISDHIFLKVTCDVASAVSSAELYSLSNSWFYLLSGLTLGLKGWDFYLENEFLPMGIICWSTSSELQISLHSVSHWVGFGAKLAFRLLKSSLQRRTRQERCLGVFTDGYKAGPAWPLLGCDTAHLTVWPKGTDSHSVSWVRWIHPSGTATIMVSSPGCSWPRTVPSLAGWI